MSRHLRQKTEQRVISLSHPPPHLHSIIIQLDSFNILPFVFTAITLMLTVVSFGLVKLSRVGTGQGTVEEFGSGGAKSYRRWQNSSPEVIEPALTPAV